METWQMEHNDVIRHFLTELNNNSDRFILKGGTALKQCYGLDRFSEDIDLDAVSGNMKGALEWFCNKNNYSFSIKKDTDLVKRYMLDYGSNTKKLKIEVSYRRKSISDTECTIINGIKVYGINALANMKAAAYAGRDKLRDLYDLSFICEKFFNDLSDATKLMIQSAVQYKGIEQCEFLLQTQKDPLIKPDVLIEKFLNMYEKLELRISKAEKPLLKTNTDNKVR